MAAQVREWIHRIKDKPIPVLTHTVDQLRRLNANDMASTNEIVAAVEQDPGLTVQLLRYCNGQQSHRLQREVASVQQAVMLVGTRKLGQMAMQLPTLHKSLKEPARSQTLRVFCRAYHAGMQALAWARQRRDMTPDEVFAASQLHFLGEMMLAMHAPEKLQEIFRMRREQNIASEEAQYLVLGFTLDQLSLGLAEAWSLPQLVIEALHAENANHPRGFGIMLAVQLARGAAIDWYSDKTLTIQKQAAKWLDVALPKLITHTHRLAVEVAHHVYYNEVLQSAALLLQDPQPEQTVKSAVPDSKEAVHTAAICLMPQVNVLKDTLNRLKQEILLKRPKDELINIVLEGMHDGIGLNRVVFAVLHPEDRRLLARAIVGAENDPVFNRFSIRLDGKHLFSQLLEKSQAVCINDANRSYYWSMVPADFKQLVGTNSFMTMSLHYGNTAAIVYADRHTNACQVDEQSYHYFKKLCGSLTQALQIADAYTRPGKPVPRANQS